MKKEAQSSIEFVIIVAFILFFFSAFFLIINENIADKLKEKQNLEVKNTALVIQDEINMATKSSEGYTREFKIPEKIRDKDYEVSITEEMVYARTWDNKSAIALPVLNITGDVVKGINRIRKINGMIYLN